MIYAIGCIFSFVGGCIVTALYAAKPYKQGHDDGFVEGMKVVIATINKALDAKLDAVELEEVNEK